MRYPATVVPVSSTAHRFHANDAQPLSSVPGLGLLDLPPLDGGGDDAGGAGDGAGVAGAEEGAGADGAGADGAWLVEEAPAPGPLLTLDGRGGWRRAGNADVAGGMVTGSVG
jgi:hypothetical protein